MESCFGDDYSLTSVSEAVAVSLSDVKSKGLGVNYSQEQTWYAGKNPEKLKVFEKLVPGQNTLKK